MKKKDDDHTKKQKRKKTKKSRHDKLISIKQIFEMLLR